MHPVWKQKRYTSSNVWPSSMNEQQIKSYNKETLSHVVEVRDLPQDHPLYGEQGLFAAVDLDMFDVIGSYTGVYVDSDARGFPNRSLVRSGHYLVLGRHTRAHTHARTRTYTYMHKYIHTH